MRMRVRPGGGLDGPVGGFLETGETHKRNCACAKYAEEQRIEWTQMARVVRGQDGGMRIAGLRVDECERVMTLGKVRA